MVMLCFITIIIIITIDGIYDTELFLEDSGDVVRAKEIDIPRFYLPVICASTYKDLESRI